MTETYNPWTEACAGCEHLMCQHILNWDTESEYDCSVPGCTCPEFDPPSGMNDRWRSSIDRGKRESAPQPQEIAMNDPIPVVGGRYRLDYLAITWRTLRAVAGNYVYGSRGEAQLIEARRLIGLEIREQHGDKAWERVTRE